MSRAPHSLLIGLIWLFGCLDVAAAHAEESLIALGRTLFFDTGLSEPPGQACATCHDPNRAFSDGRDNGVDGALSLGADGVSLGTRNAPALTYAALIPSFGRRDGHYSGGLFVDGRAGSLAAQALEPILNPLEMALPNTAALHDRLTGRPYYREAIADLFGAAALDHPDRAADAAATAIAAFERSAEFATFDSRYDQYLLGRYTMTREEAIGRELFFSDLINCGQCHLNDPSRISERETFTNHRYHNIGVPPNTSLPPAGGVVPHGPDPGLAGHPVGPGADQAGRFRVPSLRNVAVTAPYMHNGVFQTLEAAVIFYAQYLLDNRPSRTNPETGAHWRPPEVPGTIDLALLRQGQPIDQRRVEHLVAFLETLTDQRYEHLLK